MTKRMTKAALLALCILALSVREGFTKPYFADSCVVVHNSVRQKHGAPQVTWDPELASRAQIWANKLSSGAVLPWEIHESSSDGENIAYLSSPTCKEAVEYWMDEKYDYHAKGYCLSPPDLPDSYLLHFTQVVWKATRRIGVGISGNWIVVRYSPAGNWAGQFGENVQC
ncbi:predicted protein [Nematostella vectensis]|uniref:SCP domain-containing protein n=1 Tax=Nematostella vectensis TaxID=45351 RepID=A7SLN4_NEMVE|nr:pathogenesis-related leaf protein 4 [Nematostella vectensis]EDO35380.1 predicted protein [Nematostella vectensis]|eukprot:XP_001627480.1 predicted protein [Nematostella vectensis]